MTVAVLGCGGACGGTTLSQAFLPYNSYATLHDANRPGVNKVFDRDKIKVS